MNFGQAIEALKEGKLITRSGWNGKGMFVIKQIPATIGTDIIPKMQSLPDAAKEVLMGRNQPISYRNQMLLVTNEGKADSWVPSSSDCFAEDWHVLTSLPSEKPSEGNKTSSTMIIFIAMACHEANKAWCEANADLSQQHWGEAQEWQRTSAIKGVEFRLNNPNAGPDAQHNSWMKEKVDGGWVYGEVKDAEAKTHPCIVVYDQLPEFQRKKDALFCAIVDALK